MRYPRRYLTLIGLLAVGCAPHFNDQQFIRHVAFLASDELAGRGVGTPEIDRAADYIAQQFQQAGLRPCGDNGGYFQYFTISLGQDMLGRPSLSVAGAPATGLLGRDFIPFPFSAARPFEGPLAFVGYGIHNPKADYDDYQDFDATGKVLLMFRYEPRSDYPEAKFGGQTPSPYSDFQTKGRLAMLKGAAAVLIVNPPLRHEEEDKLFAFNSVHHPSPMRMPMLHVSREYANRLLAAAGADDLTTLQRDLDNHRRRTMDLYGLIARGDPGLIKRKVLARNVVAELPGDGPNANEYVVIGAHYDHLGRAMPRKPTSAYPVEAGPQILNGADDNASGAAGLIELAKALGPRGPANRSILFLAFSGEETGLLGSAEYVKKPTVPLEKTAIMLNLDMIGRMRNNHLSVFGTETATQFDRLVKYHAELLGLELTAVGSGAGPSDQLPFYSKQVPVLHFYTGHHEDYHMPGDDTDKINAQGGARVVQLAYELAESVAAAPGRPTYATVSRKDRKPPPRTALKVRLGVMPSFAEDNGPGLLIQGASAGSPAELAGLRDGDRIIKIGTTEIHDVYGLMAALKQYNPGDELKIEAMREGNRQEFTAKLEAGE